MQIQMFSYTTGECPEDKFKCSLDGNCIPNDLRCNGVENCDDKSDEDGCSL